MTGRNERVDGIRRSAADHAVVRFAASSLLPGDGGFTLRPTFETALEERLSSLGPSDDLVAAVLGLVDLAYVLRKEDSAEAADGVLRALGRIQGLVDEALATLPSEDESLAALRGARFAAFTGDAAASRLEARKPPEGNQVASGPLARAAMSKLTHKNDKT